MSSALHRVARAAPTLALAALAAALCGATSAHAATASRTPSSATALAAADSARVPAGISVPSAPVGRVDGVPMVGVNELARLLGATKFWRADVRKLVLRAGEHQLTFTSDNPFVLVDARTVRLEHMVVLRSGELQIPVEVVHVLPTGGGWPRLAYDADARQLRVAPSAGFVGSPRVLVSDGVTRVILPTEQPDAVAIMGRSRARFRVRVAGGLAGALPDSLPDDALVRDLAVSPAPDGVTFELAVAPEAAGWRLDRDPSAGRVTLTFARGGAGLPGLEDFATEGAPGPRALRMVVLDPGHGGSDPGSHADGLQEKVLTLELAQLVADELLRRAGVHSILTRRDDRDTPQELRAEIANRARADAVISLHFETLPEPRARGTLAWCPPAKLSARGDAAARATGLVTLVPWREVALERAVESRGLAESVTSALEHHGFGPSSVRERLPRPLVGVESPGILLECGTLSNPEELARLRSPAGLRSLASAIVDGLVAWQRNQ